MLLPLSTSEIGIRRVSLITRDEPFRLFFPLGILLGCAGVSHWLFYDLAWIKSYSKLLHGALQIQCFLMSFATGFLFTALPRFMGVEYPTRSEVLFALLCLVAMPVFLFAGFWRMGYGAFLLIIGTIVVFALRRFPKRRNTPPQDFIFVPMGLANGALGALLQILYWSGLVSPVASMLGLLMINQGMFLCLIMGIGGFLAPRLMGHETLPVVGAGKLGALGISSRRVLIHEGAGLLLFMSFAIEAVGEKSFGQLLRAIVVSIELFWTTQCYKIPVVKDRYVVFLWISLWMVLLGLWAEFLMPLHRIAALHILFIGGFSLMTLSVATRVTLSHLGYGELLDKKLPAVTLFGVLFLAALAIRFGADWHPTMYFHFLSVAAVIWMSGGIAWLVLVLPKIVRGRPRNDVP